MVPFVLWGLSRGGTGAISNSIGDAAREAGAEIRTEAPIEKIILKNGQAKGVVLTNGDEIYADVISSSVDPRLTFMKMVGEDHLPSDFADDLKRYKYRGSSGKVNLALDGLPNLTSLPGHGTPLARSHFNFTFGRLHGAGVRRSGMVAFRDVRT